MAEQTIDALAAELMAREMRERPAQFEMKPNTPAHRPSTVNPETMAMIGGLADAASTYAFLKRGTGSESNAMFGGMSPLATAGGVAAGALGAKAVRALIRKAGKPGIADLMAGMDGAHQIGLAALNVTPSGSANQNYTNKVHDAFKRGK